MIPNGKSNVMFPVKSCRKPRLPDRRVRYYRGLIVHSKTGVHLDSSVLLLLEVIIVIITCTCVRAVG